MSFSISFTARSRNHALRLLTERSSGLPTSVLSFLKVSLENLLPPKDAQRVIQVEAYGHLCDSSGSSPVSNATIKVTPIDIPD
jgi:hypothetical protein